MRNHTVQTVLLLALLSSAACSSGIAVGRAPGPSGDVVVVDDDDRGPRRLHGVPPGHFPPPGQCRLWYPGEPPGHQPPPRPCRELRGAIPPGAFILYNRAAWDVDYDWRRHERRRPGSVPRIILELVTGARR